jgi:hypothetical protein
VRILPLIGWYFMFAFSFDVGRSMFDVGRSSFKPLPFIYHPACREVASNEFVKESTW